MRIAIIGAGGQLATALEQALTGDLVLLSHDEIELVDLGQVTSVLESARCDLVINTAAYNLVDKAEDEPDRAFAVNALGPRHLALVCERLGSTLLHVSTDYVFGLDAGRHAPYSETDVPGPLSAYAVSKLAGEQFVQSLCRRHYIVRTCGLYGPARRAGKRNFVDTMRRLGNERSELRVVADQRCTPTSALDVAHAIAALCETGRYGLYHATNTGDASWHQFATEIFRLLNLPVTVVPISSAEFSAKARRPAYSVLDTSKLASQGIPLRPWPEALADYLSSSD